MTLRTTGCKTRGPRPRRSLSTQSAASSIISASVYSAFEQAFEAPPLPTLWLELAPPCAYCLARI
ncbi:uncharacterized protein ANIA_11525 [Aspergillus nidulans FGSC A4]|uniref:Uncharacterized protein n=1 Tax=Emericella nidulans (strain FGSC A4 / ATCC 38163 / CBS 112.46 / NRRL 194 / M139) TaxID=227321 RepID=C8V1N3_EMENI|nr:hypothetical protein [Aspergillus nidulans FGSC A4]CBF71270.1 TPA: hypothetical protein ANIA_11525 [Aspergillus nidulans FGSC A4]